MAKNPPELPAPYGDCETKAEMESQSSTEQATFARATRYRFQDLRCELVKIAFQEALRPETAGTAASVATTVVAYADAVLAEMEKEAETEAEPSHDD